MRAFVVLAVHQGIVEKAWMSASGKRADAKAAEYAREYDQPDECTVVVFEGNFWPGATYDGKMRERALVV